MTCSVYTLESHRWGKNNEYTQLTIHDEIRKDPLDALKYLPSWAIIRITLGFRNEFESAIVNEPSVFESLKVYFNKISTVVTQ